MRPKAIGDDQIPLQPAIRMSGGRAPAQKEWRTLQWLAGYEISEDGDVRHTHRKATRPAGYVLKGCTCQGYRVVKIPVHGAKQILKVHRLVCEAFNGAPGADRREVAHNDGNRANNHFTNLRWATRKENDADRVAHGTGPQGEGNPRSILTWENVHHIRAVWDGSREHIRNLATVYGLTTSGMASVCNRRTWRD